MKVEQHRWTEARGWDLGPEAALKDAQLVLAFGSRPVLQDGRRFETLRAYYPKAHIVGCSTAGEIQGTEVSDGTVVATAIRFDSAHVRSALVDVAQCRGGLDAGRRLADALDRRGLVHVFVVSDGHSVNGSELAEGLQTALGPSVTVTGGLAGDGDRFEHTLVFADDRPREGLIAAVGFYGAHLRVGYGSLGGWDPFGPQRVVTRSRGNVLYELDGQPALALYKKYLGEYAKDLPAAGLLFPLSVQVEGHPREVVRTILAVDEASQSLTFAGDLPEGSYARLMKANFDRLVDGAHGAAESSALQLGFDHPQLAILISCVGRKLVLKQRTEQELEAVRGVLGPGAAMTGFYSYGEICPAAPNANCELHNQTMTITTMSEV